MTLRLVIPGLIWGWQPVTEVWECQGFEHLGRLQSDMRMGQVRHCSLSAPLLLAAVCKRLSLSFAVFWGTALRAFIAMHGRPRQDSLGQNCRKYGSSKMAPGVVANSAVKIRVPFVFLLIHLQGVFFISASIGSFSFC